MTPAWQIVFSSYYTVLEYSLGVVSVLILLSSLDDLFVDIYYWTLKAGIRLGLVRGPEIPTPEQMRAKPEQFLALMVPCWKEDDVIAAMIENLVSTFEYRNYVIFVGTYCNDAATINEVERMRRRYRQLRRVEVPNPGPTCKADCLNWIIQAIFLHEQQNGMQFAGVIQHDSEDVMHPLELKLFNFMLPKNDMVQIPVLSLERKWHQLVASTYADEFVEAHTKDMVVRHHLTGMIPSAGVGTCFSRAALVRFAETTNNQPFNADSLTEDYDVGMRLARMGMTIAYARVPVLQNKVRRNWWRSGGKTATDVPLPLCVFEYFPATLRAAYRQKARWVLGISLVGWQQLGWKGSWPTRYFMFRDRKGLVTAFASVLAYVIALQFALFLVLHELGWVQIYFPSAFADFSFMHHVLAASGIAFLFRIVQRAYFVSCAYGWLQGLLSVPRIVVSNWVNFLAVGRAVKQFGTHLLWGAPLVWDKTAHDFPSKDQLSQKQQSLEEVLVEWQVLAPAQVQEALAESAHGGTALADVLRRKGWVSEAQLQEALAFVGQDNLGTAPAAGATAPAGSGIHGMVPQS